MKFLDKVQKVTGLLSILFGSMLYAQQNPNEKRLDGVVAVVGEHVILDSDIDKMYLEMSTKGADIKEISRCEILGMLMEDKFYAHHAVQDSIPVSEDRIKETINNNIEYLLQNFKTMDEVVRYYRKSSEEEFRSELYQITKQHQLIEGMKSKIIDEVEITPEEVRSYFKGIPKESRPIFGIEVEVAQIIIKPEVPESEVRKAVNRLNDIREDILKNGSSFSSKAILYSEDPGSKSNGGFYKITRKSPMVKEFKDVAFSLQQGEISKPFETEFGWHIIYLEKIKGQELELRHILIIPKVPDSALKAAREKALKIREKIVSGALSFAEAARSESDEKETKANGGTLINPKTQNARFELTRMDPTLYAQISNLKQGEISQPIPDQTSSGEKRYKLLTVTNRYEEHEADYTQDYTKIKEMALQEKQMKAIKKWFDEKLPDTYISIDNAYKGCTFQNNWLKK